MGSIALEHLCIEFPVPGTGRTMVGSLKKTAGGVIRRKRRTIGADIAMVSALQDINLTFSHGDRVGILGSNGAGKSTLLKVIAGIYPPSRGRVAVDGRLASIFRAGLGLEPERSGYDNIFTAGLIQGYTRSELREKTDEIVEFTELGDYLHMPVRTYSAGMRTRLIFAVATSIRPEILVLDEGIGAGDDRFAKKANQRMQDMVESVDVLLVASHSMQILKRFCNKGLLLAQGSVVAYGELEEVSAQYQARLEDNGNLL